MPPISPLRQLILNAQKKAQESPPTQPPPIQPPAPTTQPILKVVQEPSPESNPNALGTDRYGNLIEWNTQQAEFIELASTGKSCVLIGPAGTGKTTSTNGGVSKLLQTGYFPQLTQAHKHLPIGAPGIVFLSYTRRAVMNLRRALPEDIKDNALTIHKFLEYQPVFFEMEDPVTGEWKKTMRFEPNRCATNPVDEAIKTVVFDESSMLSVELFHKVWCALPNPSATQFIFIGDIQQLPPIFGPAILGFKMNSLPVVELTQVYRQALESPIIRLAHRILSGNSIPVDEFQSWHHKDQLTLHPWKKRISADNALLTIAAFFKKAIDTENYQPLEDMILIPFNKACGTDELNKHIANHIARRARATTYEVIAGYNKHYFSVGEKVLYEKEDAVIVSIERNPTYIGKAPQKASPLLDYWGCVQESEGNELAHHIQETGGSGGSGDDEELSESEMDAMLEKLAASNPEDRVRDSSHIIEVQILDSGTKVKLKAAAEVNALLMAYALTVHKSQGSEWRKVFLILHQSHNTMIQRELLYTAVTRAREELYVICEPDSFEKGINGQRIKGNTLEEKAEHFKGKLDGDAGGTVAALLKEMMA